MTAPLDLGLTMLLGLYLLFSGSRVHPYYSHYFGEIAGGLPRVAKKNTLQVGCFGEGLATATRFLNQYAKPNATVFVGASPKQLVELRSDLRIVQETNADFLLLNKCGAQPSPPKQYAPIHTAGLRKAKWVWVYGRVDEPEVSAD
jgi:hypothetical protein